MKSTSIYNVFSLFLVSGTAAFSPAIHQKTFVSTTNLGAVIFAPPDDDNCELEGSDCEESVFARKKREKGESETKLREAYVANGLKLSDIDRVETVDQYQNAVSGGIIPGVQLTALMEDD
mmetsp:Transcript_15896/g.23247  ORF Transcript_15896/g.23247 Transcript_15896/m.23247 type:complete len:120 (-) Transcript_15896:155-514(-)|eukprot:CAMPEP_0197245016 /NCGR_PEP_ID=MMETSP1429-20130617/9940_1 /TAXON_ID=49237 /ORGANISM="Chaetoceros  sp., Strain UNC1202" /LENGTH=119 /DNA_ID=CAMNT_0042705449 /DNA_START=96 /DNA_END=455 /DNA_ORIENTATION=-